jgi:hypothetical protein
MTIQTAGIDIKSSTIGLILQEKNLCVPLDLPPENYTIG